MVKLSDSLPQGYCNVDDGTVNNNSKTSSTKSPSDDLRSNVEFAGAENIMLNRDADNLDGSNSTKPIRNAKKKPVS